MRAAQSPQEVLSAAYMLVSRDTSPHPAGLAAQVIRSNDVMYKAGQTEMVILRKLSGADPAGKRHCVRMLRSFEYRQHLCLVFENMVSASSPARDCWAVMTLTDWHCEHSSRAQIPPSVG